ncbi:MAG: protein kinase [Myxococcota bacterium]
MSAHVATCGGCRAVLSELTRAGEPPPDTTVGRYVLKEKVGAGGMGAVWAAWDPRLSRRVALKISHTPRAAGAERFVHERHILAGLEHPHIARLLDAGETSDQRPWFAMDFVDGEPIDRYCERHRLTVRQRVELMLPVLDAVDYAHRHLVVHRDLKPANVLVDRAGRPHLVDFGIARLLETDVRLTETGHNPMTPAWASPEQARGQPVTTSSDVYSLGVVLYELLAGTSPYRVAQRSVEALLLAIRDEEPVPMSRAAGSKALARELEGDLDAVVGMALRKEPAHRYPSVAALAADLRAWLDGEATAARRGDTRYRFARFVRRHKLAVAGVALLFLSLAGGLAATLYQARLARAERDRAQHRFEQLRALAHAVVFDYHDGIADLPGSTAMRERLVKDALGYLDSLAAEAGGDVSLQGELAAAYLKVGDVQGDPFAASLGDTEGARKSYLRGRALAEAVLKVRPGDRPARRAVALSEEKVGAIEEVTGKLDDAIAAYERARLIGVELAREDPREAEQRYELSRAELALGQVYLQQNRLELAAKAIEASLSSRRAAVALSREPRYLQGLGASLNSLADLQLQLGRREDATRGWEEAVSVFEEVLVLQPNSASARRGRAIVVGALGSAWLFAEDFPRAVEFTSRALALAREEVKADPENAVALRDLAVALAPQCQALAGLGRFDEALAAIAEAAAILEGLEKRESTAIARRDLLATLTRQGYTALDAGKLELAEQVFTRLRDRAKAELASDQKNATVREWLGDGHYGLGQVLLRQSAFSKAAGELEAAFIVFSSLSDAEPGNARLKGRAATALTQRGRALLGLSRRDEACRALSSARETFEALEKNGELFPAMRDAATFARQGCP